MVIEMSVTPYSSSVTRDVSAFVMTVMSMLPQTLKLRTLIDTKEVEGFVVMELFIISSTQSVTREVGGFGMILMSL